MKSDLIINNLHEQHTHTPCYYFEHTPTHTHTLLLLWTHTHTHTHTPCHYFEHTHTHTHTHTPCYYFGHTHTHTHTHPVTNLNTRTLTHTHTHTLLLLWTHAHSHTHPVTTLSTRTHPHPSPSQSRFFTLLNFTTTILVKKMLLTPNATRFTVHPTLSLHWPHTTTQLITQHHTAPYHTALNNLDTEVSSASTCNYHSPPRTPVTIALNSSWLIYLLNEDILMF